MEMMTSRTEVAAIWTEPAAILVGLSALFTEDGADIRVIDGELVKGDVRAQEKVIQYKTIQCKAMHCNSVQCNTIQYKIIH